MKGNCFRNSNTKDLVFKYKVFGNTIDVSIHRQ